MALLVIQIDTMIKCLLYLRQQDRKCKGERLYLFICHLGLGLRSHADLLTTSIISLLPRHCVAVVFSAFVDALTILERAMYVLFLLYPS
jgi:hypothetical protein